MNRPERVLGEGVCAEPILIADHHEAEVQVAANEAQVLEHALGEAQFLERVDLLVLGFAYERPVAVNEEYLLLFHFSEFLAVRWSLPYSREA